MVVAKGVNCLATCGGAPVLVDDHEPGWTDAVVERGERGDALLAPRAVERVSEPHPSVGDIPGRKNAAHQDRPASSPDATLDEITRSRLGQRSRDATIDVREPCASGARMSETGLGAADWPTGHPRARDLPKLAWSLRTQVESGFLVEALTALEVQQRPLEESDVSARESALRIG